MRAPLLGGLMLCLTAGQAWAICGIGDADGVQTNAGQGNISCADFSNPNALGGFTQVPLTVVYTNNSQKEVQTWTSQTVQPDLLIGFGGTGNRCAWDYLNGQLTGGGLTLDGDKSFQALIGCTDGVEKDPPAQIPAPIDTALNSCDIDVTIDGDPIAGTSGVTFGIDSYAICTVNGEGQFPCVSYCQERPAADIPATCATEPVGEDGTLPYECRSCEASKDVPNEQGLPYCVEYVNSYCETHGDPLANPAVPADPGCLGIDPTVSGIIIPRAVGDSTNVVHLEYKGSQCGLTCITLGGREYCRWVQCN